MEHRFLDSTYNALHNVTEGEEDNEQAPEENDDYYEDEEDDIDFRAHHRYHSQYFDKPKKVVFESFDFTVSESLMWRRVSIA
jgi:hypothetical protein